MYLIQSKQIWVSFIGMLFAGLLLNACTDSPVSSVNDKEIEMTVEAFGNDFAENGTTNVYISDKTTDTYDPLFPPTADPAWQTSVCYQENSFGINANWSNPHKAFEVGTHPWEPGTFDAKWINASPSIQSNQTADKDGTIGPDGFNWTRYDKEVAGNGDFVIQLLADNCSWIYLADENGYSPQLIGYQPDGSTPGKYGVSLDGNHTLIFIIFDGGGLAGGKFRLETTESFGGEAPEPIVETPIIDTTAPVLSYSKVTGILWPPNHKMVLVASDISALDIVDGPRNVEVTVTSNEDSNGKGDGNTNSDWEVVTNEDGSKDVYVRSERSGKGNGRTYTISMSTSDVAGNSSSDSFDVQVAHNKGRGRGK